MNVAGSNTAEEAAEAVEAFETKAYRNGSILDQWDGAREFARLCSLPFLLTPELVHYLRERFMPAELRASWDIEVDLLLDRDVCRAVGREQFMMHDPVQRLLRAEAEQIDSARKTRIQQFLLDFVDDYARRALYFSPEEEELQRWFALAVTDDGKAQVSSEVIERLQSVAGQAGGRSVSATHAARLLASTVPGLERLESVAELSTPMPPVVNVGPVKVYVSCSWSDAADARETAEASLAALSGVDVGAGAEDLEELAASDVVVIIVGGRSKTGGIIREYEAALTSGKPCLAYLLDSISYPNSDVIELRQRIGREQVVQLYANSAQQMGIVGRHLRIAQLRSLLLTEEEQNWLEASISPGPNFDRPSRQSAQPFEEMIEVLGELRKASVEDYWPRRAIEAIEYPRGPKGPKPGLTLSVLELGRLSFSPTFMPPDRNPWAQILEYVRSKPSGWSLVNRFEVPAVVNDLAWEPGELAVSAALDNGAVTLCDQSPFSFPVGKGPVLQSVWLNREDLALLTDEGVWTRGGGGVRLALPGEFTLMRYHPEGRFVAFPQGGGVETLDLGYEVAQPPISVPDRLTVTDAEWDQQGLRMVFCSTGAVGILGRGVPISSAASNGSLSVAWLPGENYFAVGSVGGALEVWDTLALKRKQSYQAQSADILELKVSAPSGSGYPLLACASADGQVSLWEIKGSELVPMRDRLTAFGTADRASIAFHPDDPDLLAAVGSDGKEVNIWRLDRSLLQREEQALKRATRMAIFVAPDDETYPGAERLASLQRLGYQTRVIVYKGADLIHQIGELLRRTFDIKVPLLIVIDGFSSSSTSSSRRAAPLGIFRSEPRRPWGEADRLSPYSVAELCRSLSSRELPTVIVKDHWTGERADPIRYGGPESGCTVIASADPVELVFDWIDAQAQFAAADPDRGTGPRIEQLIAATEMRHVELLQIAGHSFRLVNGDMAEIVARLPLIADMAVQYTQIDGESYRTRVTRKHDAAEALGSFVPDDPDSRKYLSEYAHDGFIVALAAACVRSSTLAPVDLDSLLEAAGNVKWKHARYMLVEAFEKLARNDLIPPARRSEVLLALKNFSKDSDTSLDERIRSCATTLQSLGSMTRVLVVGRGALLLEPAVQWVSERLGRALAGAGFALVSGGWEGVDYIVSREFVKEARRLRNWDQSRLLHSIPEHRLPKLWSDNHYNDCGLRVGEQAADEATVVVLVGGKGYTYRRFRHAVEAGQPVIPIAGTRGDAGRAYSELMEPREVPIAESHLWERLELPIRSPEEAQAAVDCVIELITTLVPPTMQKDRRRR